MWWRLIKNMVTHSTRNNTMILYVRKGAAEDMLCDIRSGLVFTRLVPNCKMAVGGLRPGVVFFLCAGLLLVWGVAFYSSFPRGGADDNPVFFNITSGFIIAIEPNLVENLHKDVATMLRVDNVTIVHAVNGTEALRKTEHDLPLYVQNLVRWGRHDHMQLYSGGSLGCLLSHIEVWRQVTGVSLVLEEDAVLDAKSLERLQELLFDMKELKWDLLMLETGHLGLNGVWRYVGNMAATCANWSTVDGWKACNWMGSRGYLITERGAELLLKNAHPLMVQTDALMGLTATFDPTFSMYWTLYDVAHPTYMRRSRLWDGCIKCYAPVRVMGYIVFSVIWMMLGGVCAALYVLRRKKTRYAGDVSGNGI